ncbi:RNA polymerase I-specific transcription initiation factor RRN3 [Halotydeus destructor]|nr:RNA polymerase I-specific transcription initiation factor RRN3 [Halotydeus destructor]
MALINSLDRLFTEFHELAATGDFDKCVELGRKILSEDKFRLSEYCFKRTEDSPNFVKDFLKEAMECIAFDLKFLDTLIRKLVSPMFQGRRDLIMPDATELEKTVFGELHSFCKEVVDTFPQADRIAANAIKSSFPFHLGCKSRAYSLYVYNYLWTVRYDERETKLVTFVMDRMQLIDLECCQVSSNLVFNMEQASSSEPETLLKLLENSLDQIILWINEFIKDDKGEHSPEKSHDLFLWFFGAFKRTVLPSQKCRRVQYLMFYVASLSSTLADEFIDQLWNVFVGEDTEDLRLKAVCYMVSFTARCNLVDCESMISVIELAVEWLQEYDDRNGKILKTGGDVDVKKHVSFYRLFQASIYLILVRRLELRDDAFRSLRVLGFQKLVTSKLNPLAVFCEPILDRFADLARHYQIAYCAAVIEANQRQDRKTTVTDDCFLLLPFDLKNSEIFKKVEHVYRDGLVPLEHRTYSRRRYESQSASDLDCKFSPKDSSYIVKVMWTDCSGTDEDDYNLGIPMEIA